MATKTAYVSKDARIAQSGGLEMGAGASDFMPAGLYSGYLYRILLGFNITSSWFSGMFQFQSATIHYRTSTQHYVAFGSSPSVIWQRLTEDFSEGSASSLSSSNSVTWANQPGATTSGQALDNVTTSESNWESDDISDMFEAILPSSVLRRDGNPGTGNGRFYGVRARADNEGSSSDTTEIYSDDTGSEAYIVVTFSTNAAPTAPAWVSPANGALLNTPTPTLVLTTTDSNDTEVDWDIQIDNNSDFSSPLVNLTAHEGGTGLSLSYLTAGLPAGTLIYARVRARDDGGAVGNWSSTRTFTINRAPTGTKTSPTASDFAEIWNLQSDLSIWTLVGAHAKPWFRWTYSDPDGHGQKAYRVRVYSASVGGALLHDSGKILSGNFSHQAAWAGVHGTEYWWTLEVWDTNDYSAGESSRTGFKMKWGQALYEHNPGAGSSSYQFTIGNISGGTAAFLYRSATGAGGAGASAWQTSIGAVTPNSWLQILVRLATSVVGTNPTLSDMTFTYLGSSSQPDRWVFSPSNEWGLDPAQRRYGSQSLKCTLNPAVGGNRVVYPYRKVVGDDIPVVPGTIRTFSVFVKTNGILTNPIDTRVAIGGGSTTNLAASELIWDTTAYPDGWRRVQITYDVPEGVTTVRPQVVYNRISGVAESFWIDGCQDEEGTVASAWQPGFVGDPVVLDSNGVMIDGAAGGIWRMRAANGGSRDQVELGLRGLLFGGDVELWTPSAETLQVGDGLNQQSVIIEGPNVGTAGGRLVLGGAGANPDVQMVNEAGRITTPTDVVVGVLSPGGNGVLVREDGSIELTRNAGTPYIDFKNDMTEDRDARVILQGDDLLEISDADLLIRALRIGAAGKFIQRGTGSLTWPNAQNASAAVVFPVTFDNVPVVICQRTATTATAPKNTIWPTGATTSGFTVYGTVPDGGTSSASVSYYWIAIDAAKII